MDIKLKSNHKLALLIILLAILLPSLGMIWLYPYFSQEAQSYKEDITSTDAFIEKIMAGNYVLYLEDAQRTASENLSPVEVFFPNVSDSAGTNETNTDEYEYMSDNLRTSTYDQYNHLKGIFTQIRSTLKYQVVDTSGNTIDTNTEDSLLSALSNNSSGNYSFIASIQYDSLGTVTIKHTYGANSDLIKEKLFTRGSQEPFSLNSSYEEEAYSDDWVYQGPKDRTFIYAMSSDDLNKYFNQNGFWDYSTYLYSGSVVVITFGFMIVVALIAFFLPFSKSLNTGNEKLFRAPAELALTVLFILFALSSSVVNMVTITNNGNIFDALRRANFSPAISSLLEYGWNIVWWCIIFGTVYWSVSCLRAVVTLGLMGYWKERTIIYHIYYSFKKMVIRIYSSISNFDLSEKSNKTLIKIIGINFLILLVICSLWFFGIFALIIYSIILFFILHKYFTDLQNKYKMLLRATNEIADGNLDVVINEDLGVFEPFKDELQKIQSGFRKAVVQEVKSQRMKTDLITNVSHDLKTPLTAIITYVNLLKTEADEENRRSYTDVLEQKALRLKVLIEDLFEISKATSQNVTLNYMNVDIVDLLKQVRLELSDKIDTSTLDFRWHLPPDKIILMLDSQKTYRVFENLLVNILNYALDRTRVYVDMNRLEEEVCITMKNISACELNFNPQEITERFVRGDASRNTEGSGLGLAIAKSFVELQGGKLDVSVDADLFKAEIRWTLTNSSNAVLDPLKEDLTK